LFDTRFEYRHQAGVEPRGVDAVEHLRVGERRHEDLLDDVFVCRT